MSWTAALVSVTMSAPTSFTPFFSTKRTGTGIGLALVEAIVRAHGGSIDIRNEGDGGAIVELVLPAAR